jgi:hypothetical protein
MISKAVSQPQQKHGMECLHPPLMDIFYIELYDQNKSKTIGGMLL